MTGFSVLLAGIMSYHVPPSSETFSALKCYSEIVTLFQKGHIFPINGKYTF